MTEPFPWTKEIETQLLKGFDGNTPFKVIWPWAPFHEPGFKALRWAAEKKLTAPAFYKILDDLSCPGAPAKVQSRLRKARLLDQSDRMIPLDPAPLIKKTFALAQENFLPFGDDSAILLTVEGLLAKKPQIETLWRPLFLEEQALISKWLLRDQSLLKSFHEASPWNQFKIIETLVGLTKPSSILNFERIY